MTQHVTPPVTAAYPIRVASAADMTAIALQDGASFGFLYEGEDLADALTVMAPERLLVATDGDRLVGVAGDYEMTMTMPGGASLDLPGVTWVSVAPTHRRRGILRSLMERQLRGYVDAGHVAATLTASEGGIYERFGYGAASLTRGVRIDRRRAQLRVPVDTTSVTLASTQEARAALPDIHERWRQQIPAALHRNAARWDLVALDRTWQRHGQSGLFYLLHPDGYVAYRAAENWTDGHTCHVIEYAAATPEAHAALWQVLLNLDLYATIETDSIPVDDPIIHLLTDARLVRTTSLRDGVWLRPLQVPALVSARRYALEFDVVWQVTDELLGDGRYRIQGGPEGATCTRTDALPDLTSDVSVLGALSLGGHRLQSLVAGGRVQVEQAAVLTRLDRALLADRAPFHGTDF